MIGIYKITNKINNKSYIGQSIHCGKRFDEHFKGKQFIDEIIQVEGVEHFTFEILKQVDINELSYWEDYYIIKFNTMFPNGYNKRWNCNQKDRNKLKKNIEKEQLLEQKFDDESVGDVQSLNTSLSDKLIHFVMTDDKLIEMEYSDTIYAWLLLHSYYNPDENYNYIYEKDFSFTQIGNDIGRSNKTVSKRFKKLIEVSKQSERGLIYYDEKGKYYILPCFKNIQKIYTETILKLFKMSAKTNQREELIKTYAWLKKQNDLGNKALSYEDLIKAFGHTKGNKQTYDRYKELLMILQEEGLISFEAASSHLKDKNKQFKKTLYISQVNDKTSKND